MKRAVEDTKRLCAAIVLFDNFSLIVTRAPDRQVVHVEDGFKENAYGMQLA